MATNRSTRPSADGEPVVISATSLKSAHKKVRDRFGDDAVILDTRTVTKRQVLGLGHEKAVEILVQRPGAGPIPTGLPTGGARASTGVPPELLREVERIETLVAAVVQEFGDRSANGPWLAGNPAAEALRAGGAGQDAVRRNLTRFVSETGLDIEDRPGLIAWLGKHLRASNCGWDGFYGCHAFLGESGTGRSDMILAAATRMRRAGKHALVLSVLPSHAGHVRRLQVEASAQGYDAAVLKREDQLASSEKHLGRYDVVLLDLPRLTHPALEEGAAIHDWLARNPGFHRHLVVPLDRDLADIAHLGLASRSWNCDWVAMSRLDCTERGGKLLDLLEIVPLPVSLLSRAPMAGGTLDIATTESLLDLVLAGGTGAAAVRRPDIGAEATV